MIKKLIFRDEVCDIVIVTYLAKGRYKPGFNVLCMHKGFDRVYDSVRKLDLSIEESIMIEEFGGMYTFRISDFGRKLSFGDVAETFGLKTF